MHLQDTENTYRSSASLANSASKHIPMHLDNTRANIAFRTPKRNASGSNPLGEAIGTNAEALK